MKNFKIKWTLSHFGSIQRDIGKVNNYFRLQDMPERTENVLTALNDLQVVASVNTGFKFFQHERNGVFRAGILLRGV